MTIPTLEKLGRVHEPEPLIYKSFIKIFNKPKGVINLLPDLEAGKTVLIPTPFLKLTTSGTVHREYNPHLVMAYRQHADEIMASGNLRQTKSILTDLISYMGKFGDYENMINFTENLNIYWPVISEDFLFKESLYRSLSNNFYDAAALIQRRLLAYLDTSSSKLPKLRSWYLKRFTEPYLRITGDLKGALEGSVFYNNERTKLLKTT